jgi:hypothetical protein
MMTGLEIAQRAKEQLVQLTGLKYDTVSAFAKDEQGWHVMVEMVEMKRIPDARDVLATYESLLDDEGNLLSYQRTRRYLREQVMEKEE